MGAYLRQKYITQQKFLNPTYDQKELKVVSSNLGKNIQSAESLLMGLYPPAFRQNKLLTQNQIAKAIPPISVNNLEAIQRQLGLYSMGADIKPAEILVNFGEKDLILQGHKCKSALVLKAEQDEVVLQEFKNQSNDKWKQIFDTKNIKNYQQLEDFVITQRNRQLNDSLTQNETISYFEIMKAFNLSYSQAYNNWKQVPNYDKLVISAFLEKIQNIFVQAIADNEEDDTISNEKLSIYNSDETLIHSLNRAFNDKNKAWNFTKIPQFFVFELYESQEKGQTLSYIDQNDEHNGKNNDNEIAKEGDSDENSGDYQVVVKFNGKIVDLKCGELEQQRSNKNCKIQDFIEIFQNLSLPNYDYSTQCN
eukprot:403374305